MIKENKYTGGFRPKFEILVVIWNFLRFTELNTLCDFPYHLAVSIDLIFLIYKIQLSFFTSL